MTAVADQISIRDVEGLGDRFPAFGGSFGFVADVGGTLSVPRIHFDVAGTGLSWGNSMIRSTMLNTSETRVSRVDSVRN